MTTEQTGNAGSPPPADAATAPRLLRRRHDDRILGGVASGIADYLNVDPVLIRAAFVGLVVFGGAGFVVYILGWALIPADGEDRSAIETAVRGLSPRESVFGSLLLIALVVMILVWVIFPSGGFLSDFYVDGRAVLLVVAVGVGLWLLGRTAGSGTRRTGAEADVAGRPPAPAATQVRRPTVARRPAQPASPLGLYVVALALIAVGMLALVGNVAGATVLPGQFFGAVLTVIGLGLAVGAWWGRARWLILPAVLLLPFAWAASYLHVPFEGGFGEHSFAPLTVDELADEYQVAGGHLRLDLTRLAGADPIEISADVGIGQLQVDVPDDAAVRIDAAVGAGYSTIFDNRQSGTNLEVQLARGEGREIVLDLEAGMGAITVYPVEVAP